MIKRVIRKLFGRQRSHLCVINADGSGQRTVHTSRCWLEAPNWSPDGKWLVFNTEGQLFRIAADAASTEGNPPVKIETGMIRDIGNDHVISPDGLIIFFTAKGVVYRVPFAGGDPQRVSPQGPIQFYVHGISPNGAMLSCVGYQMVNHTDKLAIYLIPVSGGDAQQLTDVNIPVDGAEFSPDGNWIYFNGELHARRAGDSQLFKMRTDGSEVTQLSFDERVNWFPHISPNGKQLVYLSYVENTQGHPANHSVILRCLSVDSKRVQDVISITGGQGTFNTNSWAPDSTRFAFVCYSAW